MITEERFWALLVESNPFPGSSTLDSEVIDIAAHVAALEERSGEMSSQTEEKTDQRHRASEDAQRRNQAVMKWLAAALVAVVVGLAVFLIARSSDDAPVVDGPLGIVTGFLDAQNRHDGRAMASLTAPDAALEGLLVEDPAELDLLAEFERAIGWQVLVDKCIDFPALEDGSARVFCTFGAQSDWNRALGRGVIHNSSISFVVKGEKIRYVSHSLGSEIQVVQTPFMDWLNRMHPEDVAAMFREEDLRNPDIGVPRPRLTPETISLFTLYTEEYVAQSDN